MNHEAIQKKLGEYYDGELDSIERDGVEAHLAGCAQCRQSLESWRQTAAVVFKKQPIPASEFFVESVMARIRQAQPVRRQVRWSIPVGWLTPALGIAAMLLLMLLPAPNLPLSMETFLLNRQDIGAAVLSAEGLTSDELLEFILGGSS